MYRAENKFHILVVDDIQASRDVLVKVLRTAGYIVSCAESGNSAFALIRNHVPDLILLDVIMPDMDGYEVCQNIKNNQRTAGIPIIFLSAHDDPENKREAFEQGGVDFIAKPFNNSEVISRVKTHLSLNLLQRELEYMNHELEERVTARTDELIKVQQQLAQSQKLEAIGHITAGIAHDFKNLIGIIMSGAEYMQINGLCPENAKPYMESILDAAHKAKELTGNLLAFSRQQQQQQKTLVDIHELVNNIVNLIKHSFDRKIEISITSEAISAFVQGNPASIQTALLNLALNARDAMPEGGRLSIKTELCGTLPERLLFTPEKNSPSWLLLEISDNGCGISPKDICRVFEPYFTTKDRGCGTGLGLSTVYAMLRDHNAALSVSSSEGEGTAFRLYFPHAESYKPKKIARPEISVRAGTETILIVDDELWIRRNFKDLLSGLGYKVYTAENGKKALELYMSTPGIDLVIVDMIMPVMNGLDTVIALMEYDPQAKIIISTGFSERQAISDAKDAGAKGVVYKPTSVGELTQNIDLALRN